MAISDCPECNKPVSTEAKACPHCGCPLRAGKKKTSYLGPLLLILFALFIVASYLNDADVDPARKSTVPAAPRCDPKRADSVIQQFIQSQVLLKIDATRSVPRIYVLEAWHHLTIDEKKTLDNVVQCYVTHGGANGPTLAMYHDGRSNKEVATSDTYGFRMK